VAAGGAADRAGLPVGGVVVAAEGRRIDQPDDLIGVIKSLRPGESLMLSYYQGGTLFRKSVKLAEAPAEGRLVGAEDPPAGDRPLLRKIEKAIEGVAGAVGERPAGIPFLPEAGGDLRSEVTRLRTRVDELERRLAELEGRLGERRPAAKPEDDAPSLKLNPAEPPKRPEPEDK
jgi:hypothetical protein